MNRTQDEAISQEAEQIVGLRLDQQYCFPLYATSRQMTRLYGTVLEPLGLTYPQYLVLLVLWEKSPRTVSEIGSELQLNTNTLTPLLKRLEQLQYLERKRSKADERVVEVGLTPEGQTLREACLPIPQRLAALLDFDASKMNQLRQLLGDLHVKITDAIAHQEASPT